MNKICEILINSVNFIILGILGILMMCSIFFLQELNGDAFLNNFFVLGLGITILGIIATFSKMSTNYKICFLLIGALVLRLFWILSINTVPKSDFSTMYEGAINILSGDTSVLKGYSYLSRFPHLIPMTLYMATIIKFFPVHNLLVMKLLNVVFSCVSVYLLYKLSANFIKNERNRLFVLIIGAIFPPFITYTSVLCTENLALPLYLIAINMFYKAKNSKKLIYFFVTGILLALSNLFRAVGIVFLIACLIDIFLGKLNKKTINIFWLIFSYIISTLLVNVALLNTDLIERPLWAGTEPSGITLLLKGSNFEFNGMWNIEDAEFIDSQLKNENFINICLTEIKKRLFSKTPFQLGKFYFEKIISQWSTGDCFGTYWAYSGANMRLPSSVPIVFQALYVFILGFSIVGLVKNSKGENFLLNIALFGFILLFAIIETQPRYSYIISWVFIILASQGIEFLLSFKTKNKLEINKVDLK